MDRGFFRTWEQDEFLSKYKIMLREVAPLLDSGDVEDLKKVIKDSLEHGGYSRVHGNFNGLIRAMETTLIVVRQMNLKRPSILAAMLFPIVDSDNDVLKHIEEVFGEEVGELLKYLAKVKDLYQHDEAIVSENFRRLLMTIAQDLRVIMIMIADRLALLRRGKEASDKNDLLKLCTEVSFIYAPMAHRMGLYAIKSELEDLTLKYTDRQSFDYIKTKLNETKRSRDAYIKEFITPIKNRLEQENFSFEIKGRTKSIHSINRKLKKQNIEFENIYDLFAIRIVLDVPQEKERSTCWLVYSIITDMYQPNPKRMKDWISIPKSNGYESLHITVMGPENRWVEVQIRTQRMDEIAEKGLAAHWKYKGIKSESGLDEFLTAVRESLEDNEEKADDALSDFKLNLYDDEIYVFTPKGELKKLPRGATVLDFAFNIHTRIGSQCVSALVNGKNVSIRHVLNNGDTVQIITNSNQTAKADWLNVVVTSRARVKIKQTLREQTTKMVAIARELLQRRIRNRKMEVDESIMSRLLKKKGYKTTTDFYLEVVDDRVDVNTFLDEYLAFVERERQVSSSQERKAADEYVIVTEAEEIASHDDVLVIDNNVTGVEFQLAKCCNPIYGDEVFGYVSNQGIKIHRMSCPNAPDLFKRFGYRIIEARWSGKGNSGYIINLLVIGNDDIGIVNNITSIITKEPGVGLRSFSIDSSDSLFRGTFSIRVQDTQMMKQLMKKIKDVRGVKSVERLNA